MHKPIIKDLQEAGSTFWGIPPLKIGQILVFKVQGTFRMQGLNNGKLFGNLNSLCKKVHFREVSVYCLFAPKVFENYLSRLGSNMNQRVRFIVSETTKKKYETRINKKTVST